MYGLGHSEIVLGKVFKNKRDIVIATKVGLRWNNKGKLRHDLSSEYIREACQKSLSRLQRERIELYQIHWPDPMGDLEESAMEMESLVERGLVASWGASNLSIDQLKKMKIFPNFISYQGRLNLFDLNAMEELLPWCSSNSVGFIAYEPLFKGLLTGKFDKRPTFPKGDHRRHKERFKEEFFFYSKKIEKLKEIAKDIDISLTELSLSLLLEEPGVTTVIPGAKDSKQVRDNIKAASIDIQALKQIKKDVKTVLDER